MLRDGANSRISESVKFAFPVKVIATAELIKTQKNHEWRFKLYLDLVANNKTHHFALESKTLFAIVRVPKCINQQLK